MVPMASSPAPMPRVIVVFPAPNFPESKTKSPGCKVSESLEPNASMASGVSMVSFMVPEKPGLHDRRFWSPLRS